jgi:hypothetical protein
MPDYQEYESASIAQKSGHAARLSNEGRNGIFAHH